VYIVELLLKYGALPSKQAARGEDALMAAIITGSLPVVSALIEACADRRAQPPRRSHGLNAQLPT
jgi:hypothetical protein